jgi:DGQHR domain-containing protein
MATTPTAGDGLGPERPLPTGARPVVVRHRRQGELQVSGVMTAEALTRRYVIPRRDHRTKKGYQREVSTARVNRLASDLAAGRVDLPTAVLLNLRDFDEKEHLFPHGDHLHFMPGEAELYVVDGQHRIEALARLIERDPARWADFEVLFACLLGATEREEMEEFYVVNSTAKSVRTDLALDLLKQRAETDPNIMRSLVETSEDWKVTAQAVTEELDRTSVWRGRIRFPGEAKAETTIGSNGMVASLKPLLATPYFGAISRENQVKVLSAFWEGTRAVLPEVFAQPLDYGLQKSTGVMIMHTLLISTLENIRAQGRSVLEPDSYADVLGGTLRSLEGDTANGRVARGAEFWRSGPDGAAGSFSSNAGRRVLSVRLRGALPDFDVE